MCEVHLSIITINFNNLEGLRKTIDSVLNQTFTDYEYIIIDGGSTDGSRELIQTVKDWLSFWCSEPDSGIYNAMNKGILQVKGEYTIFLNSGDYFYSPDVLQQVVTTEMKADVVFGKNPPYQEGVIPLTGMRNPEVIFCRGTINHQTAFIKSHLLKERPYDESFKIVSDWKFFFEAALDGYSFELVDVIVAVYDTNGISGNIDLVQKERMKVFSKHLPEVVAVQLQDDMEVYSLPIVQNGLYLLRNHPTIYLIAHKLVKVLVSFAKKKNISRNN